MSSHQPEWTARYFDEYGESEWMRLVRSPLAEVKLHVHKHYLERHLRPGAHVLEVGAGPGRFTQVLAQLGARITVVDLSPVQVELNQRFSRAHGFAEAVDDWHVLDICDLSTFANASFDGLVCYGGPLSYVFDGRHRALAECVRVVRPGGLIWLSVMSLFGSQHELFPDVLDSGTKANRGILATGDLTPVHLPEVTHRCHLFRASELQQLLADHGLDVLDMAASNCLSTGWDLTASRQDPERWAELLYLELEATREAGCLDMGSHLIAVVRTPGG